MTSKFISSHPTKSMRYKLTPEQLNQLPLGSFIDIDRDGQTIYRFNLVDKIIGTNYSEDDIVFHLAYINPITGSKIGLGLSYSALLEGKSVEPFTAYYEAPEQEPAIVRSDKVELFHVTYADIMMEYANWNEEFDGVPSPGIPEIK